MSLPRRCASLGTKLLQGSRTTRPTLCAARHSLATSLDTSWDPEPFRSVYDVSRILDTVPVPVRTLYPPWLKPEDYIDLSDRLGFVKVETSEADLPGCGDNRSYLTYWQTRKMDKQTRTRQVTCFPFPVNTRGFLYFKHSPVHPIASALRFRLAQKPDVDGFLQGRDLLTPYGTRWEIPLVTLASSYRNDGVKHVLRNDGLVPPQLYDHCTTLPGWAETIGPWSQVVYTTYQPFYLDLGTPRNKLFLVGMRGIDHICAKELFAGERYPFKSGIVLCRFEPIKGLAMRIMRVIEPVRFVDQYKGGYGELETGKLVRFRGWPRSLLSRRNTSEISTLARWKQRVERNAFAWSWDSLEAAVGEDWTFPWNSSRQA